MNDEHRDRQRNLPADEQSPVGLDAVVSFQRELYLYWSHVQHADGLPLTARGFVTRAALRGVRSVLERAWPFPQRRETMGDVAEGDDPHILFLRRLLERLGLLHIQIDAARLAAADRSDMARFLAHPLAERLRICARVWVGGAWWPEHLDPRVDLPRLVAPAPPRVALARRRAVELIAAHTPGDQLPVPSAERHAAKHPRRQASHLRHHQMSGPAPEDEHVRDAMLGPLAWMGFVVPDAESRAQTCRVGIGIAALTAADGAASLQEELVERAGRVVVQADLSLVAYPPLTAQLLLSLDTCAERVSLDVVARYRLSREAMSRARATGCDSREVIARLEALTEGPLPTNVATTLADWERHAARLRLSPEATILLVREADILDTLLADRTARGWIARRLTPTAALVIPAHAPRVRQWLLRHGELPMWCQAQGRGADNRADGRQR